MANSNHFSNKSESPPGMRQLDGELAAAWQFERCRPLHVLCTVSEKVPIPEDRGQEKGGRNWITPYMNTLGFL